MYPPTYEVNRIAVGGSAKAVRDALKQLGMRQCSLRLVYYQCEARELRLDWYGGFARWVEAIFMANRQGAEFLVEDFLARVEHLRARYPPTLDWYELAARAEEAHSEAMQAAIRNQDMKVLMMKLSTSIAANHSLLVAARFRLSKVEAARQVA